MRCVYFVILVTYTQADTAAQRVRIAALKFLSVLPQVVRYDVLHPQKAHVLRELSKVLDDPKRSVRKEAVDARYVAIYLLR